jgi:hypothetical protein
MPNRELPSAVDAVLQALAADDLQSISDLLAGALNEFMSKPRTAVELDQYLKWLKRTQSAVRVHREHLAQRLCALPRTPYGRSASGNTWSMQA